LCSQEEAIRWVASLGRVDVASRARVLKIPSLCVGADALACENDSGITVSKAGLVLSDRWSGAAVKQCSFRLVGLWPPVRSSARPIFNAMRGLSNPRTTKIRKKTSCVFS